MRCNERVRRTPKRATPAHAKKSGGTRERSAPAPGWSGNSLSRTAAAPCRGESASPSRDGPPACRRWLSSGPLHDSQKDLLQIGLLQRELGDRDAVLPQRREKTFELGVAGQRQQVGSVFMPQDALA